MTASSLSSRRSRSTTLRSAIRGGLALALLIGGANLAQARRSPGATDAVPASANPDKAVAISEAVVAKAPQDAVLRAALGQAYIHAGRFEAALSGLSDAVALGDGSGATALSLALAQIACGQNRAALATLDRGAATIAPAELGLALALAGDTEHGIAVLTDGLRAGAPDGSASPTLRQNLAYAYALAGRWADASLAAGLDLPPDQASSRLQQWAQSMEHGGERIRIARLLDVPMNADQGMPTGLALNGAPPAVQSETAQTDASGELMAVAASPVGAGEPMTAASVPATSLAIAH